MEILQIISLVISIPSTAIVLLTAICKPFRKWLLDRKDDKENSHETDRCLLRDRITSIYYKHSQDCEMKLYDYENLERLYKQYKNLGGNSFVDKIWEEIQDSWKIDRY